MTVRQLILDAVAKSKRHVSIRRLEGLARVRLGVRDVFVVRDAMWRLIGEGVIDFTPMRDVCRGEAWGASQT